MKIIHKQTPHIEYTQAAMVIVNMECSSNEHAPEQTASIFVLSIDVKVESTQASHEVLVLFLVQISY